MEKNLLEIKYFIIQDIHLKLFVYKFIIILVFIPSVGMTDSLRIINRYDGYLHT